MTEKPKYHCIIHCVKRAVKMPFKKDLAHFEFVSAICVVLCRVKRN
jgi:hypothetical protein